MVKGAATLQSMTGFASASGEFNGSSWSMDIRSVNGRGLDVKCRVPDWIEGLEQAAKSQIANRFTRGNITLNLRVTMAETVGDHPVVLEDALDAYIDVLKSIETRATARGLTLTPPSAADIMAHRVISFSNSRGAITEGLKEEVSHHLGELLDSFETSRKSEGEKLGTILTSQLTEIANLVDQANHMLPSRQDAIEQRMATAIERLLNTEAAALEDRIAQEIAAVLIKMDITEEIDRLKAHIVSGRDLLAEGGPVGRKLDFLTQEFNREANTLCSKSQDTDLTRVGLALKVAIDQMREQVQNLE